MVHLLEPAIHGVSFYLLRKTPVAQTPLVFWHKSPGSVRQCTFTFLSCAFLCLGCGMADSALWLAAQRGCLDEVKRLMRRAVDKSAVFRALEVSVRNEHMDVTAGLMGSVYVGVKCDFLALVCAVLYSGSARVLPLLFARNANAVAMIDDDLPRQYTLLGEAAATGHLAVVQGLVALKVNVNNHDLRGRTALVRAVYRGDVPIARFLLENNATVLYTPLYNVSLVTAARRGDVEMAALLLAHKASLVSADPAVFRLRGPRYPQLDVPLFYAATNGRTAMVKFLLDSRAPVDYFDGYGGTPLLRACANACAKVARVLLTAKASVDAADLNGNTPLHHACTSSKHVATARVLLEHKARTAAVNRDAHTPLSRACAAVAALLIAHDAQAHGAHAHGAQAHGTQAHGTQAHGAHAHGAQGHGAQAHGAQVHGAQAHGARTVE